jgi:hypothetical protein
MRHNPHFRLSGKLPLQRPPANPLFPVLSFNSCGLYSATRNRTHRETDITIRGKSVDFVLGSFGDFWQLHLSGAELATGVFFMTLSQNTE